MQKSIFMQGGAPFKLGLFGYLHDGGVTMTKVPERWAARWDDIVAMAKYADESGLDFLLPYARWKGMPGDIPQRTHSFETLTHAAALAGHTKRIGLFATVHTPIIHPAVAAKMIMTIMMTTITIITTTTICGPPTGMCWPTP